MKKNTAHDDIRKNLVFLFTLSFPGNTPKTIYSKWPTHPVLKEYERPTELDVFNWVEELESEGEIVKTEVEQEDELEWESIEDQEKNEEANIRFLD